MMPLAEQTNVNQSNKAYPPPVPRRFVASVVTHLARNFMGLPGPLILGIEGPPGVGKTYGLDLILRSAGVKAFSVSGGQLESPEAGRPAQRIRQAYRRATRAMAGRTERPGDKTPEPRGTVVLFQDVDAGLGDWGQSVQSTVNRQTALGELLHLADYPEQVAGQDTPRVPIIMTGNDFTKLYSPLRRYGRMELLKWVPTRGETRDLLRQLFPELGEAIGRLLGAFPTEPIAFFAEVRRHWEAARLTTAIRKAGSVREAIRAVIAGKLPLDGASGMSIDSALEVAARLSSESTPTNYLSEVLQ